ncbi:DUF4105 domain-containing protein [Pseudoalteromonas luteoviolacea]|uniref:Lnb N-terminal periplasmic domain-containing protein n=1 Tax=Pseudoalteromonas luteoviolacea TaxID=43657 RepID=UPI001B37EA6F|nr:DUF4105 domain-containing protein [Pseudoalteromonas luteoviolacea]MBQ4810330.1 DUF4105 domain-containing protein [Pseudoalteromonas luteoviolacea]
MKRSAFASFFLIFSISFQAICIELTERDYRVYDALLHKKSEIQNVQSKSFISTNSGKEIKNIISLLKRNDEKKREYVCQFPARAYWINERFYLNEDISFEHCPDLKKYLDSISAESISLVYASENLTSPSSFMGHTYLKINGQNEKEHAVSYFTEVDTINIPKLMYDSIVTGKEGYFIVSPYQESEDYYSDIESRNIYEYHLGLADFEVKLISLHLWELKDKRIDYFFHTHNCATITLDILGVVNPSIIKPGSDWLSPLDVIKIVNQSDMVTQATVKPSLNWRLRAYGREVSNFEKETLLGYLKNDSYILERNLVNKPALYYHYLLALNEMLYLDNLITEVKWLNNENIIDGHFLDKNYTSIDVSNFKNPLRRSSDSQIAIQLVSNHNEDYLQFDILPASHLLTDDNRHAFSESSLKLLSPKVILSKNKFKLEKFELYSIAQYIPYDPIAGGVSGYFSIGYSGFDIYQFDSESRFYSNAGLGLSVQPHPSLQLYSTFGLEASLAHGNIWLTPAFDVGAFAYLKGNNKVSFSSKILYNEFGSGGYGIESKLQNSYFWESNKSLVFGFKHKKVDYGHEQISASAGVKIYY